MGLSSAYSPDYPLYDSGVKKSIDLDLLKYKSWRAIVTVICLYTKSYKNAALVYVYAV
jgi:hypothetical protein